MIQYVISVLVFFNGIILTIYLSGIHFHTILNLSSFIIVGILPFLFVSIFYGFKDMATTFSIPFKKENTQGNLLKAYAFFQGYEKVIWITGFIYIIISAIDMFSHLEKTEHLIQIIGLELIPLLYCCIINVVIIIPLSLLIKKQMKSDT